MVHWKNQKHLKIQMFGILQENNQITIKKIPNHKVKKQINLLLISIVK